ncbi:hypothetical protein ACUOFC_44555, partial [Escherichia sp. TWPC-MK]
EQQIIIGKGVADALKVKQGDWVSIMIPNSNPEHKLMQPKRVRLHVAGILQLSGQLDHSFAMIPLADAQQYLDMGSSVSGIALKMTDVFHANHQYHRQIHNGADHLDIAIHIAVSTNPTFN